MELASCGRPGRGALRCSGALGALAGRDKSRGLTNRHGPAEREAIEWRRSQSGEEREEGG